MLELELESIHNQQTPLVQEEPELEIALPQIFSQPRLTTLRRGKIAFIEALATKIYNAHKANPDAGLGTDYQTLVTEFQPLFSWALACWDYLLSTQGCRFLPRVDHQKICARGDYRVVTDKDFSRLVHRVFRNCVLEFAQNPKADSLNRWLRERFWPTTVACYQELEIPLDPRQRALTPYSYLRCVPYRFLNEFHHELVYTEARQLPLMQWKAVDVYFLHFYTETACAESLQCPLDESLRLLQQGLTRLLVTNRLVYCLLRQIERY